MKNLIGTKTLELKGVVTGHVKTGTGIVMILDTPSGGVEVEAAELPDWLNGNSVSVRMLVTAGRSDELASPQVKMLGVAAETQVANWEKAQPKAVARTSTRSTRTKSAVASRKGGRPAPLSGSFVPRSDWQVNANDAVPIYAQFIRRQNSRLSLDEATRIAAGVVEFSVAQGVDARLIMAMVMVESGFDPNAKSHAGAMGLGQLMPGTAKGMGVGNPYDSIENLNATVRIVRGHLENYHRKTGDAWDALVLMLAAYNAGSGAVRRHGGVPPYKETQNYVRKVTDLYRRLCGA